MTGMATLALIAVASWLLRIGFLVLIPASRLPDSARTALDDLAPAVLAAIVAVDLTAVLTADANPVGAAETLVATGLIGFIAWRTRSLALAALLAIAAICVLDLVLR